MASNRCKTIALLGRAKTGKSFTISRFVENQKAFADLFSGNSDDKTLCQVETQIEENVTDEHYQFRCVLERKPKEGTEKEKGLEEKKQFEELKKRITALVGHQYKMDDVETMSEIEAVIGEIEAYKKSYADITDITSDISIVTSQRPSDFCKEILEKCNLFRLTLIDTQGVSGNVEAEEIPKSDIYMFVLRTDNKDEAQTLKKVVNEIKADVATKSVVFLYRTAEPCLTKENYDEAKCQARENMEIFNPLFDDLRGSIISTDISLYDPAGNCLPFIPMRKTPENTEAEKCFYDDLEEKLFKAFGEDSLEEKAHKEEKFLKAIEEHGDDMKLFVKKVLEDIPNHEYRDFNKKYEFTTDDIRKGQHYRVKTGDGCRLVDALKDAYHDETRHLFKYFSEYNDENCPNEWQKDAIRYIFSSLHDSVSDDRGMGKTRYPLREDNPPRTMLVEESIFAEQILEAAENITQLDKTGSYCNALINNGIIMNPESKKWVYCDYSEEAKRKLCIIKECLINKKVYSMREMVRCRYVVGLRKVREYDILVQVGYDEAESMEIVKKLSF